MEFSLTTLVTIMMALGLIATDTYVNSNSLDFEATVASKVSGQGYSPTVVEARFIDEIQRLTDVRSLIAAPTIRSSGDKSFSMALADLANMGAALRDIQDMVGFVPPRLHANAVTENDSVRLLVVGHASDTGLVEVNLVQGETETFDLVIQRAARDILLKIDPYTVVLNDFNENLGNPEKLEALEELVLEQIALLPKAPINPPRAHLENLLGIIDLTQNALPGAEKHFRDAAAFDGSFHVARLNLAFLLVQLDRYEEAIETVSEVIDPWYWPAEADPTLLATGHVTRGVAQWGLGDTDAAQASFSYAATLHPSSTETYVYWSNLMEVLGDKEAAKAHLEQARQNTLYFENYPEVALLYFWLTEQDKEPLQRRTSEDDLTTGTGAN